MHMSVMSIGIRICLALCLDLRGESLLDASIGDADFESSTGRRRSRACHSPAEINVWWPHPPRGSRNAGR